jgi:threonine dehydrogenase-like Zn-dependent dehydrogenase
LALVPDTTLLKVPDSMPVEVAILIEPMACGIRAVKQAFPDLEKIKNSTVVVLGVGPIGLFATAAAKLYGARKVIAIDRLPHRLDFAKQFGADLVANRSKYDGDELSSYVKRESNNGIGADGVIECTGELEAVEYGLPMLRKGGRFVEIGRF